MAAPPQAKSAYDYKIGQVIIASSTGTMIEWYDFYLYHLGNGEFGGFTPLIASSIVAVTGNIYTGLAYPIAVTLLTFVVGTFYLPETNHVRIWDEVE